MCHLFAWEIWKYWRYFSDTIMLNRVLEKKLLLKNVHILICILVKKEVIKPNLCDCCYNKHLGPYWISVHCSINAPSISAVTRHQAQRQIFKLRTKGKCFKLGLCHLQELELTSFHITKCWHDPKECTTEVFVIGTCTCIFVTWSLRKKEQQFG